MQITKIFKNGNSQAVRIPAGLAFDNTNMELEIERIGDEIRIRPARQSLENVMDIFANFSSDFMSEGRDTHEQVDRDTI